VYGQSSGAYYLTCACSVAGGAVLDEGGGLDFPLTPPITVKVRLTGVFTQGTTWIALINLACTNC